MRFRALVYRKKPEVETKAMRAIGEWLLAVAEHVDAGRVPDHWPSTFEYLQGHYEGQRSIRWEDFAEHYAWEASSRSSWPSIQGLIMGLHEVCVMLGSLITHHHLDPEGVLRDVQNLEHLRDRFKASSFVSRGFLNSEISFGFAWSMSCDTTALEQALNDLMDWIQWRATTRDPKLGIVQDLYEALCPRNLLHACGEHYTPRDLALDILDELGFDGSQTLLDPYMGSGAILLAAVDGHEDPLKTLTNICGIDINPVSCQLAVLNLIARCAPHIVGQQKILLPVVWADTLLLSSLAGLRDDLDHGEHETYWVNAQNLTMGEAQTRVGYQNQKKYQSRPLGEFYEKHGNLEQLSLSVLGTFDFIVSNPPWIGWEYMPKRMKRQTKMAWQYHRLVEHKGMRASFLKEDLSTLAVVAALELFSTQGTEAVWVLRSASVQSVDSGRALRSLQLSPSGRQLRLNNFWELSRLALFTHAKVGACVWFQSVDEPKAWPVLGKRALGQGRPSYPRRGEAAAESLAWENIEINPTSTSDVTEPWSLMTEGDFVQVQGLMGTSAYQARVGVFTAGANGVYHFEKCDREGGYRNITERAKRHVPAVEVKLDEALMFPLVTGRDLQAWDTQTKRYICLPHHRRSKINPISLATMKKCYPKSLAYFEEMKEILEQRRGFASWERDRNQEAFYGVGRVGAYTFSNYKVCWAYISDAFTCTVLGKDDTGKPLIPNDKVVYIGVSSMAEAAYLAAYLSAPSVKRWIESQMKETQVSSSIISRLYLPKFNKTQEAHRRLSRLYQRCRLVPSARASFTKKAERHVQRMLRDKPR